MIRVRSPSPVSELGPRCYAPHTPVRRAAGGACAVVWCRCTDGGATAHLVEDPTCRGCVVQRLAWRLHLTHGDRVRPPPPHRERGSRYEREPRHEPASLPRFG